MGTFKARAIWSTNLLLLLVCVGTVMGLVLRPHEMKVTVAFCGYSNNSRGTLLANVKVRNEGSVTIRRCRQYTVDERQQSSVFSVHCFLSDNILLGPRESEVVEIFPTPDMGEWRAGFLCLPCGWKMWLRDRIEPMRMTDPSWKWRLYRWIAPTNTPIYSEWIAAHDDAAQQRPALDCSMTTGLHSESRWLAATDAERYTTVESSRVDVRAFSKAIKMKSP